MNSYSKVIRTFISSIVGFALISSPSLALNSNFHQEDSNNVQNNINTVVERQVGFTLIPSPPVALNNNFHQDDPSNAQNNINTAYLLDLLHLTYRTFEDIIYFGNQFGTNTIFSSLNSVIENLNGINDQFLEECSSECNNDSYLKNIIIQALYYSKASAYSLCYYFRNYDQNIWYALYTIYGKLCYIESWILGYNTNDPNNILDELMPNLSEEEFYNR